MNPQYLTSQSFPALTAFPALSLDYFYNQILVFQQGRIYLFSLKYHTNSLIFQGRSVKLLP